jgi:ABC-2 type transport system permease protein
MSIISIAWREIRGYFTSWIAYAYARDGSCFPASLRVASGRRRQGARFRWARFIKPHHRFLFVTPLLTMKLVAEERATGSLELLFTRRSPMAGDTWKMAGALAFCAFCCSSRCISAFCVFQYGALDAGPVWGSYIALLCLASTFARWRVMFSASRLASVAGFSLLAAALTGCWPGPPQRAPKASRQCR